MTVARRALVAVLFLGACAHEPERFGNALMRPGGKGLVADQLEQTVLPREQAAEKAQHRACVAAVERLVRLLATGVNESLPELLWANFVRRFARVVLRGLAMMDTSVKVCAAVLLAVIVVSVLVFHFGMEQEEWIDAFYRTGAKVVHGNAPEANGNASSSNQRTTAPAAPPTATSATRSSGGGARRVRSTG